MSTVIARHRTAIARTELSRPLRIAFDDMILREGMTVLDYGCGLGGDVTRLRERGYVCEGWDPNHRPEGQRRPSDIVNIGYVVNVVENLTNVATHSERLGPLRVRFSLSPRDFVLILVWRKNPVPPSAMDD